jgi:hypothetical protein
MRMRRRHLVASGAICSLIVVAPGLIVANRALDTRPVCQRVDEWFDNHRHALSSRYEDVAALPIDYRRRAVARMPERIRRDLFAIHFNRIANEERLTPEQRVWLRTEARHASEMATNQHAPTSEELFRVFGGNRELIRAIVNLGDDGGSFRTPQSTMLALEHLFRVRLLAQPSNVDAASSKTGATFTIRIQTSSSGAVMHWTIASRRKADADGYGHYPAMAGA